MYLPMLHRDDDQPNVDRHENDSIDKGNIWIMVLSFLGILIVFAAIFYRLRLRNQKS